MEKINNLTTNILNYHHSILDNLNFICAYDEQLCQEKAVLHRKIKEQERAEETYDRYILAVEETLSELDQLLDSSLQRNTPFKPIENKTVCKKRIRLIKNQVSVIQSRIKTTSHNHNNVDNYHKSYRKLKEEYDELQKLISGWCQQSPVFCLFLEPFGN